MPSAAHSLLPKLIAASVCVLAGTALTALNLQTVLSDSESATTIISSPLWKSLVDWLHDPAETVNPLRIEGGRLIAELSFVRILLAVGAVAIVCWLGGGCLLAAVSRLRWGEALAHWGIQGWLWWFVPGVWEGLDVASGFWQSGQLATFLVAATPFAYALTLAGWLATFFSLPHAANPIQLALESSRRPRRGFPLAVVGLMLVYVAVYTAMNWQLYYGLRVPHGDSAMYEEHLWNVLHGKGFRSYLDQGLFLGEHIQVVHLLLIPIYWLWPSHLLLELCESIALASAALPVFWIARRHTGSQAAGTLLAAAYLLYFPMHFLDIAIDLKTFRPIAFGVPLMLFALDQLERGRYRTMLVLMLLALSAKEDFAIVIAPLGVWIALRQAASRARFAESTHSLAAAGDGFSPATGESPNRRRQAFWGIGLAVFATVYLVAATRIVIPWFRGGAEVHYARYFEKFGDTLGEIAWNMLTNPALLAGELLTVSSLMYAVAMLLPLGLLPLFSPGRLAVGLPLFVILCLNQIAQDPRHHFHAPLVPIAVWAAAGGLGAIARAVVKRRTAAVDAETEPAAAAPLPVPQWPARFAATSALATAFFFSISPVSLTFWDPGSAYYWPRLYVPGERAEMFARVYPQIPKDSRVASTDFVHPRFTHHLRSYDYSDYPRAVNDDKPGAPPDTDYIVIDTRHPYSEIQRPEQIPEYRNHPDDWELLPDETEGYFIVLKRKR